MDYIHTRVRCTYTQSSRVRTVITHAHAHTHEHACACVRACMRMRVCKCERGLSMCIRMRHLGHWHLLWPLFDDSQWISAHNSELCDKDKRTRACQDMCIAQCRSGPCSSPPLQSCQECVNVEKGWGLWLRCARIRPGAVSAACGRAEALRHSTRSLHPVASTCRTCAFLVLPRS